MRLNLLALSCLFLLLMWASCKPKAVITYNYGTLLSSDSLYSTQFVPSLASPIHQQKNDLYCATFALAWAELNKEIGEITDYDKNNIILSSLIKDTTAKNVLDTNEFTKQVSCNNNVVNVKTNFELGLTFKHKLQKNTDTFKFLSTAVQSFGMIAFDEQIAKNVTLLSYTNDDSFIISIATTADKHELLLAKGYNNQNTLQNVNTAIEMAVTTSKNSKTNKNAWKYSIAPEDQIIIPEIRFNVINTYTQLLQEKLTTASTTYKIEKAEQSIAFTLDQVGAHVKSIAEVENVTTDSTGSFEEELPHPKHLWLNGPFSIIARKKNKETPYLFIKIENTELLQKVQ